jgi:8-oxo-dGTP diphosphatase
MTIAITRHGHEILTFIPCDEPLVPEDDAETPLTFSVVVIEYDGQILLLFNPNRQQWEIPGGGIEDEEHPDDAARREVFEETSQIIHTLQHKGVFKMRLQPDGRYEYGALYTGTIGEISPYTPNDESERILLWTPGDPLDGLLGVLSETMIGLCR